MLRTWMWRRCFHTFPVFQRTLNQIIRQGPVKRPDNGRKSAISGKPQAKGVILKVFQMRPRKPNSGNRSVCTVKLSNGKTLDAFIPGQGPHGLREHDTVLVEGLRRRGDLIGVHVRLIRGKYDFHHVKK